MTKHIIWLAFLLFGSSSALLSLQAQSVDLSVSPPLITLVRGQSASFACSLAADSFAQQVFLAVDSTDFEASFGTYDFQPAFLNAPYDDTANLVINTLGTMPPGTYTFVLSAGNGGVSDADTVFLQVEADSCSWVVNNPPDLGPDEDLIGLGGDGSSMLWITARTRLIGFDSLAWQSHPYPDSAEATAKPVVDHLGRVLVPSTEGLLIWDGNAWAAFNTTNSPLPDNFVGSVLQAPNQDLYLGTKGGLAIYDGQFWSVYDTSFTNLPNNDLRDLVYVDSQEVWGIAIEDASYQMVKFTGSDFDLSNSTDFSSVCHDTAHLALTVDSSQNIWAATEDGLVKTRDGQWEKWKDQDDPINYFQYDDGCNILLQNDSSPLAATYVTHVQVDGGDLWASLSKRNGTAVLVRKRDTVWESFTPQNSTLPDDMVRSIARVGSRLWFITHTYTSWPLDNEGGQLSYIRCGSSEVTSLRAVASPASPSVRVFPNPTRDQVRIAYQGRGQIQRINLLDAQGRILTTAFSQERQTSLDLSSLPAGLYLLTVDTPRGRLTEKIIKQ